MGFVHPTSQQNHFIDFQSILDSKIPIKRMNDLVLDEECILIGVLFKQMILKPSIVKQIATEVNQCSFSLVTEFNLSIP